jgi:hypothetical protein
VCNINLKEQNEHEESEAYAAKPTNVIANVNSRV